MLSLVDFRELFGHSVLVPAGRPIRQVTSDNYFSDKVFQDNTFIEFKTTKGKLCIGYLTEKYRFKYESKIIGYKS
ncbi:hypothetical protein BpHYR1_054151 [Brachionus plicatilis]|uniref:Uncharacterized protein n=1 Tax=Brachionus plicatilis TaxID=10195 RepID=A0A3M7S983_BRAPC|nr:hypothetical protein BpHYR1_054151 [Brachionus plicatilis]